jgi:hypothetical protein
LNRSDAEAIASLAAKEILDRLGLQGGGTPEQLLFGQYRVDEGEPEVAPVAPFRPKRGRGRHLVRWLAYAAAAAFLLGPLSA